MTLHDELRELVDSYGPELLRDPEQFRAALDDYVDEGTAFPGQVNLLHDAVRFGALDRCLEMLSRGGDPSPVIEMVGDGLARERGSLEVASARWAVATLAHATGNIDRSTLDQFLGSQPVATPTTPEPPAWPTMDLPPTAEPSVSPPAPTAMPPGPPPTSPPPNHPPPAYPPPSQPQSAPAPSVQPPPSVPAPTSVPAVDPPPSVPAPTSIPADPPPTAAAPPRDVLPATPATETPHAPPASVPAPPPAAPAGETVTAPPRAPVPPPTGPGSPPQGKSRRKPLIIAFVAATLVAAITAGGYAIVSASDDDPDPAAKDPTGSSSTQDSPPSSSGSTEPTDSPPPLDPPADPELTAVPGYRAVIFTVGGALVDEDDIEFESLRDGDWTATPSAFRLATVQGGQRICAKVRAVRVEGETRAPGPPTQACEKSKPKTADLVEDGDCPPASGRACHTLGLKVTGFRPKTSYTMNVLGAVQPVSGTFEACAGECKAVFRTDQDGRGNAPEAAGGYAGQVIRVEVDGLTIEYRIR